MTEFKTTLIDRRRFEPKREATVGTARCIAYNIKEVRKAVGRCVAELPDMQELFTSARHVLLKPNLLSSHRGPDDHVNTHPAFVQAIAELLVHDFGCDVAIGDSCGTLTEGSTAKAIRKSGMGAVAKNVGASIYNVDTQPRHVVHFDQARVYNDIPLPSNLSSFDLIVSLPKMKTHSLTYITVAVKNLLGLVPGAAKKQAHLMAPRPPEFASLLCDLYALVQPGAAFVDGVMAMEGRGPSNGTPRHVELVAASCDPVALDSFCAQVMGFDPLSIPLLAQCAERGLGTAAPSQITVRGEPASAFALEDFAKPPTYASTVALGFVPRWLLRTVLGAFASRHARINQQACTRCGECARNCPSHAISQRTSSGPYFVDRHRCISCYCCEEVCPSNAVSVQGTLVRRLLSRKRS